MKNIIIKVIYNDAGSGFWSHENFSRYIADFPNSLNVSIERNHGNNPLVHVWYLNDYEVEVSYEKKPLPVDRTFYRLVRLCRTSHFDSPCQRDVFFGLRD